MKLCHICQTAAAHVRGACAPCDSRMQRGMTIEQIRAELPLRRGKLNKGQTVTCACGVVYTPAPGESTTRCKACVALRMREHRRKHEEKERALAAEAEVIEPVFTPWTPKPRPVISTEKEREAVNRAADDGYLERQRRAESDPRILARLLRGAVVQSYPIGHAKAGAVIHINDIPRERFASADCR